MGRLFYPGGFPPAGRPIPLVKVALRLPLPMLLPLKKGGNDTKGNPPTLKKEQKDGEEKKDGEKKDVSPPFYFPFPLCFFPYLFIRVCPSITLGRKSLSGNMLYGGYLGGAALPLLLFCR